MKNKKTGKISYTISSIPGDLLESFRECAARRHQTIRGAMLEIMDQYVLETRQTHRTSVVIPPPEPEPEPIEGDVF